MGVKAETGGGRKMLKDFLRCLKVGNDKYKYSRGRRRNENGSGNGNGIAEVTLAYRTW